jgi:hypothetical protein
MSENKIETESIDLKTILRWIVMPFMAIFSSLLVLFPVVTIMFILFKINLWLGLAGLAVGFPVAMFFMGVLYVAATIRFSPSNKRQSAIIMIAVAAFSCMMNIISGVVQVSSGQVEDLANASASVIIFGFSAALIANLVYFGGAYYKLKKSFPASNN